MNAMKSQGMDAKSPKASKIQDGLPKPKFLLELMSFIFCVTTPMTVLFYCIAYQDFDTALSATAKSAYSEGFLHFFLKRTPLPTFEATRGSVDSHCLSCRSFWYDLFEGGELHPRVGQYWDWRHFLSTRSGGIIAWTLIDLSFAAYQYEQHGYLTGTMFTVVLLRAVVVVDFFVNEEVFFHTLDGKYESFGFYNIYGFSAMMPVFWTLQTQYLAKHPTEISLPALIASIVIFVAGWSLRFYADRQKMRFNRTQGKCLFWGRQAQGIPVSYQTRDGKTHRSHLLCSGLWGVARHVNYAGSVLYTWSLCSLCGNGGGFAYTEAVLVTGMIVHRCFRDEEKCADKYGSGWDEYCRRVPWRIVPGVF
ncbi:7-dehydrocholesterol reductase [Aspergillus luchuensis IFO 4308]|nr:7-dehydrocholesterol reductase [Aspergillus luchuensis IFO 4308]